MTAILDDKQWDFEDKLWEFETESGLLLQLERMALFMSEVTNKLLAFGPETEDKKWQFDIQYGAVKSIPSHRA